MEQIYHEIFTQALITFSFLIFLLIISLVILITQLLKKRKILHEGEIASIKTVFERKLLESRFEIREEVLKNVSMEIHDNVGQTMLLAKVNLCILQKMQMPDGALELIIETKSLITKAIEDISQLSRSLNADRIASIGVFSAIQYELYLLEQKGLFEIVINNESKITEKSIPIDIQLVVFRMFQEITQNIIKHSKAKKIEIFIRENGAGVELVITDNGIGFQVLGQNEVSTGVGIRSLQSRISLIKGTVSIQSVLKEGTRIIIFIPVNVSAH
jgi:two-component system, NarL family, sensor kinase